MIVIRCIGNTSTNTIIFELKNIINFAVYEYDKKTILEIQYLLTIALNLKCIVDTTQYTPRHLAYILSNIDKNTRVYMEIDLRPQDHNKLIAIEISSQGQV